ncbi:MAG: hypothetical protein A2219_06260 [Elusimicrobia bacterium RIFOXYA2_FULL_50_26]|nr:MAG: hypothetical protein A2219_06260 [Elusimicrobia bacterium RIFOXYA2_FULL_50_26]OGS25413.1 MAG: hypothetical protein A2314_06745 [Elusimicrobia bacterium RIFOXYB2_FULL_50_12]
MKIIHGIFVLLITVILATASLVQAQNYRINMKTPAVQLYESMLLFAEMRKYVQIEKSLPYLKEVFNSEKENFKVDLQKDIEEAIKSGDQAIVVSSIRKAIFYDIKDIFHAVNNQFDNEPRNTVTSWLKMANLDYKILSPYIKRNSLDGSKRIDANFTRLLGSMSNEKSNLQEINKIMNDIIDELASAGKF